MSAIFMLRSNLQTIYQQEMAVDAYVTQIVIIKKKNDLNVPCHYIMKRGFNAHCEQ